MANTSVTSKLEIIIVPYGKTYNTSSFTKPSDWKGKIIFKEGSKTILVNGIEYGVDSTDLTAIISALKNSGYLTENPSTHVLSAENPGTVATLLGTKIATSGEGKNTVSGWITSLQNDIATINTSIGTDGSGNFVVRDKTGEGKTDFATTTAIQTAINTAKTGAEQTAAADATSKVNTAKSDLIGNGVDSTDAQSTALNPGENKTWAVEEANIKTLSHLKDLILNLQGQINTVSGGHNLSEIQTAIDAIEQELVDGEGTGLTTVIDALKVFIGSGLTSENGPSYTVNNGTQTTLADIITALETEIAARIASVDKASGETLIDVQTDANKAVTISSTTALTTAVSNANSAVQSVDKASGETLIAVTTSDKAVTISSTQALTTAVTNATNALPKGSSSYANAAALEAGLKGTASDQSSDETIAGAKKYADSKASDAQSAAEATALGYANSVITWTVIP